MDILGVVENMSFFSCPHCQGRIDIFGHGEDGAHVAEAYGVPLLGEIEIDPQIRVGGDTGEPVALLGPRCTRRRRASTRWRVQLRRVWRRSR